MAYTQADLDALKKAIATGARSVKFGAGPDSREVVYRSLDDMIRAKNMIEAELSPGIAGRRTSYVAHYRD